MRVTTTILAAATFALGGLVGAMALLVGKPADHGGPLNPVFAEVQWPFPLDEERIYRVATNDFLARGGDGYTMFADAAPAGAESDAPPVSGEVIAYIKSIGTLRTGIEGRIAMAANPIATFGAWPIPEREWSA